MNLNKSTQNPSVEIAVFYTCTLIATCVLNRGDHHIHTVYHGYSLHLWHHKASSNKKVLFHLIPYTCMNREQIISNLKNLNNII